MFLLSEIALGLVKSRRKIDKIIGAQTIDAIFNVLCPKYNYHQFIQRIICLQGYKPANEEPSEYQTIPLNKIEDFGVHCKQYYSLEVSYFKSSLDRRLLDSLWNKYWVNTLSSSSLLTNADYTTGQIFDLSDKLEQSEVALGRGFVLGGTDPHDRSTVEKLIKATRDSCKTTIEVIHGLMAQIIKDRLFNHVGGNVSGPQQK